MAAADNMYLGIETCTDSITGVVMNSEGEIVSQSVVEFDLDLPEFRTRGGVHPQLDRVAFTAPVAMWVKAVDMLMKRMRTAGVAFERIVALSGCAHHGAVFLKPGTEKVLAELDTRAPLANQLMSCLAIQDSPVYPDAGSAGECRALEGAMGGPQALAELTGSRACERFTGGQIARIARLNREAYDATERIALVSSFMASLFACKYAATDYSDGSCMNLMNIRTREWDSRALMSAGRALEGRLGKLVHSSAVVGNIGDYFVKKYGFDPDCAVIAFSGEDSSALAGLGLESIGDAWISLGAADKMIGALSEPRPSASEGHILINPIDPGNYMAVTRHNNGFLMREEVCDRSAGGLWDTFSEILENTAPGNEGNIGFFFRDPEVTPPIARPGIFCFDAEGNKVRKFTREQEVRAAVEGQFMSMRLHAASLGLEPKRIVVTGDGSEMQGMLRVVSQVFGVPVYTGDGSSLGALGSACRALHGLECKNRGEFVPFGEVVSAPSGFTQVSDAEQCSVYDELLQRYAALEKTVVADCS